MLIVRIAIIFLLLLLPFSNLFAQTYTVTGKVNGAGDGWAYIRHRQTEKTDSGKMINGAFIISGAISTPEFCSFGLTQNGMKDYYLSFFLEKGRFIMHADKDSLNDISITLKGGKVEKYFQQFQKQIDSVNRLRYSQGKTEAAIAQKADAFALKHPESYVSALALLSYENDLSRLSKAYAGLAVEIRRSYYGKLIKAKLGR